ncbi:MAG: manganese efflux pump MntP family protein [Candidatus Cryptobacteroides sp.]
MSFVELLLISIGLAMDAFAVSVGKGLSVDRLKPGHYVSVSLWFGVFQALMPLGGYYLGVSFADKVTAYDHWIAFVLLGLIGANMIKEALSKDEENPHDSSFSFVTMLLLAIATSIDALAVGVSFAFLTVNIWMAVLVIGVVTAICSAVGMKIGNLFGLKYKSKAELFGGIILICIGVKILVEHLFF